MRITNSMLVTNTIRNIASNTKRLAEASERQSTQSKISLPSDDPTVATNAVKYRNYVSTVEQYQENVENAISWMSVTEGAISDLSDVVQELRDKTVQAANGTMSDDDLAAIKSEVEQLKAAAIEVLNTSYAGRYVFAGYATDAEPFGTTSVTVGGETIEKVTFREQIVNLSGPVSGSLAAADLETAYAAEAAAAYDTSSAAQPISYNIGFGSEIKVNVEGQELILNEDGANLFDTIDKLLLGLDGETSYQTVDSAGNATTTTFALTDVLGDLDTALSQISAVWADLGARENYASLAKNRLSDDATVYTTLMSNNEDVDIAEATTDVSTAQTVYDASLTVGAKAITKTLLDYIV